MRLWASLFVVVTFLGAPAARAAERVLSIEAEIVAPKDKSLGKTKLLVAARGTERHKAEIAGMTLVLDADVGPTFDKDCNLVTVSGRLEDSDAAGKPRKRELTRVTIHACGAGTKPTTLAGGEPNRVVVTIRPE
jgi:hypothetical protein